MGKEHLTFPRSSGGQFTRRNLPKVDGSPAPLAAVSPATVFAPSMRATPPAEAAAKETSRIDWGDWVIKIIVFAPTVFFVGVFIASHWIKIIGFVVLVAIFLWSIVPGARDINDDFPGARL